MPPSSMVPISSFTSGVGKVNTFTYGRPNDMSQKQGHETLESKRQHQSTSIIVKKCITYATHTADTLANTKPTQFRSHAAARQRRSRRFRSPDRNRSFISFAESVGPFMQIPIRSHPLSQPSIRQVLFLVYSPSYSASFPSFPTLSLASILCPQTSPMGIISS